MNVLVNYEETQNEHETNQQEMQIEGQMSFTDAASFERYIESYKQI